MPLFRYSREGTDFLDKPHVSIKVGSGCPAGCDCQFSYKKLKKDITYSKDSIIKNIKKVGETFSNDFDIFIVGIDVLRNEGILDILDTCKSINRGFKLQISQNISEEDLKILNNIYLKYGKFDCSLPKTIDSKLDLINIINIIKKFSDSGFEGKVYFDIFVDLEKYSTPIKNIISKLSTRQSNNEYNCIIGDKFDLKFHDLSWRVDDENKIISKLKRRSCMMMDYYEIKDGNIYLDDHIEIFPDGDLVFHDNLCYLGNYKISSIKKADDDIVSDFEKYLEYLKDINSSNDSQDKKCYNCIKAPFNYKNS